MGITRADLARGDKPCENCRGVGREVGQRGVADCKPCKGRGFIPKPVNEDNE